MTKPCGRLWEIDALRERRLAGGDADSHARHRATCAECRARWDDDERLASLGRQLEPEEASELSVRRVRAEILRKAATPDAPRGRRGALALVVASALVLVVVLVATSRAPRASAVVPASAPPIASASFASTIDAGGGARWTRRRDGAIETVRVDDGVLSFVVAKQAPDERFFVELPDGRIEVRGTRFEVTVHAGATESVRVTEGLVAWSLRDGADLLLHAGESWRAPKTLTPAELPIVPIAPIASIASADAPPVAKPRASARVADGAIAEEYTAAMNAYRAREYDEAARRFSAFAAAHPSSAEAEDAAFLEASALAHGGRGDAAANVAERFLTRHPSSFHARDAAILVARAARDRGDCERARAALAPWSSKPSPELASALGACKLAAD